MGHKNIHIYSQIVILSRILFKYFISSIQNSYCFCIGNISFFGMYFLRICESLQMFLCNKLEYPCAFNEIPTFISSTWNNHYLFVGIGVEWGAGATPLSVEFWFLFARLVLLLRTYTLSLISSCYIGTPLLTHNIWRTTNKLGSCYVANSYRTRYRINHIMGWTIFRGKHTIEGIPVVFQSFSSDFLWAVKYKQWRH